MTMISLAILTVLLAVLVAEVAWIMLLELVSQIKLAEHGRFGQRVTSTHCREKRERSECTARLNWFTTSSP